MHIKAYWMTTTHNSDSGTVLLEGFLTDYLKNYNSGRKIFLLSAILELPCNHNSNREEGRLYTKKRKKKVKMSNGK